jgi:hypothetical protein
MMVKITTLLLKLFQTARHIHARSYLIPDFPLVLQKAEIALASVQETQRLVIHVPEDWADGLPADVLAKITSTEHLDLSNTPHLPEGSKQMLAAIKYGLADIRTHFLLNSQNTVRSIGYGLHVLPGLLRHPEDFSPDSFQFNFGIIAFHWNELSDTLQDALCTLIDTDKQEVLRRIQTEEFTIDMWGSSS